MNLAVGRWRFLWVVSIYRKERWMGSAESKVEGEQALD